jgi:hypothetical protein
MALNWRGFSFINPFEAANNGLIDEILPLG